MIQYNDGGRSKYGFKGTAGDCVTRAIAITTGIPYWVIHQELSELQKKSREIEIANLYKRAARVEKRTGRKTIIKIKSKKADADHGISTKKQWFDEYMQILGFHWVPTMHVGKGCQIHLDGRELPKGRLVVSCSRHMVAVIDGVINDAYDSTREGKRCVYGFYILGNENLKTWPKKN